MYGGAVHVRSTLSASSSSTAATPPGSSAETSKVASPGAVTALALARRLTVGAIASSEAAGWQAIRPLSPAISK